MVSKKEGLILAAVVIGGLGLASMVSEGDAGGAGGLTPPSPRAGGILGSGDPTGGESFSPSIYQIPGESFTGFPEQKDYSDFIRQFLQTPPGVPDTPDRGAAGVSSAGKKTPIYSSLGYAETTGFQDLPSIFAHMPASEREGYVQPKQVTYGSGYKAPAVEAGKYSFWAHLYASFKGEEEAYTSQYDYVKGEGMMPKKVSTSKKAVTSAGKALPSYVQPSTAAAYSQLKAAGYDVSAYAGSFNSTAAKKTVSTGGGGGAKTAKWGGKAVTPSTYRRKCAEAGRSE